MASLVTRLSKKKIATIWSGIFLLGLLAGYLGGRDSRAGRLAELGDEATRSAGSFTPRELGALTGARADLSSPAYVAVKGRLALIRAIIPGARVASLVRVDSGTGRKVFLADSEPLEARAAAQPGDAYYGDLRAQGPVSDASGTWAIGFATVPEGAAPRIGPPATDVFGLDVAADDWSGDFWAGAFHWTLYIWLLGGIPFGILLVQRSQREQRKAIRNLLGAMEQSHSAVMIVDLDSCIEFANASLCAQIGYTRRELLGRPWRDFQQPETPTDVLSELVATVRAGNSWHGEWFNRRRNGELYPVRGAISPVKNRDGSLACFVAVFEDMTESKRGEAVLRAALERAEAGDHAKSQFLATMSHEVRTPLNGIIGFTSLLLEMPLNPEQREYIQIIRASGEALIQLTGDILDFAHIESGALKLEPRSCDPRACVEEVLDVLALPAADRNIELLHWVDESVPASIVVDDIRLRQVLANLAGNAVKFTEAGEVAVTVRAERADALAPAGPAEPWLLTFAVRDTGIGIPPEHHGRLFKPFNQVDVSTTRRHGGTGLGLAISRNLVHLMGGTISMESEPGRGSTFTFTVAATRGPGPARALPPVAGLHVALASRPGPFRDEFTRLARRWQVRLTEVDSCAGLGGGDWDIAFVEVDAALARTLASPLSDPASLDALVLNAAETNGLREVEGGVRWPADKTHAIVPVSLSRELRTELRKYFLQVINKPLHHDALLGLLAGTVPAALPEKLPAARFELSVLVAEDNAVNQRLVQKLLWNLGCTSTLAANGQIALEELARSPGHYDLVLMDLHMPELDGEAAIEKIRAGGAGERARSIWIAAVTADARMEQKERILAAGGNDYVVKPIKLGELAEALRRFLAARKKPPA